MKTHVKEVRKPFYTQLCSYNVKSNVRNILLVLILWSVQHILEGNSRI